jgi:hypothetical protein
MEKMAGLMENLKLMEKGEERSSSHRYPVQQNGGNVLTKKPVRVGI